MRRLAAPLVLAASALLAASCSTSKPGEKTVSPLPTKVVGKVPKQQAETVPTQYKNGDSTAGKQVFLSAGCTGCHTLADANSHGTVGPVLTGANVPLSLVVHNVTLGAGAMPAFKGQLSTKQIADVSAYIVKVTAGLILPENFPRDVRVVATDFDRTLVWTDTELRPRTIAALKRADAAGVPVIVVTGRMVRSVRQALEPAGVKAPVICYQGAVVVDADGEWLRHEPLPVELARETIVALAEEGYSPNVYVDDELYVAADTEAARAYARLNRIDFHVVGDLLEWLEDPPTKLVAVGEPAALDAIEPRMKRRFGDREFISKSLPHFLEFAQAGVTKGAGLDFLSARLGFTKADVVAFGDGENDVELVEWPDYGIATANASERVKAVARWVCPSAEEEGVAQVIEALLDSRA